MLPPVQQVLEGWASLTALVGQQIYQGFIPEKVTGDRCMWQVISQVPENSLGALPEEDDQLIQLDCYSSSESRARLIGEALRDAMESVTHVTSGPRHEFESDTKLHRWLIEAEFWTPREGGQAVPLQIPFGGVKSADFNVDNTSRSYTFNVIDPATANAFLPRARDCAGAIYIFSRGVSDGVVNIVPNGADTIQFENVPRVLTGDYAFYSDGISNFMVI